MELIDLSQEIYQVWRTQQSRKVARWRWSRLKDNKGYQAVPELKEVLEWLDEESGSESAFLRDEFLWGVRSRDNAGFGLYQYAYKSAGA